MASKQIGNSVPPQFARILALSVLEQIFGVRLPFPLQYLKEGEALSFRSRKSGKTASYKTKALDAKPTSEPKVRAKVNARQYAVSISAKHRLASSETEGDFRITFQPTPHQWQLTLDRNVEATLMKPAFSVLVRKEDGAALFADVKSVRLVSTTLDISAHTVLWKAFEHELTAHRMKADLVQLNGYYQYPSNLVFEFEGPELAGEERVVWQAVENIYLDKANNAIRPAHRIADEYDLTEQQLTQAFLVLREAGYEIRNTNTNPEIEEGHYLIPYKFPTLSHLSVQLKRSL